MCGGAAILLADGSVNCSSELYETLNVLQHRGQVRGCWDAAIMHADQVAFFLRALFALQDAAGIITDNKGRLSQVKGNGLVKDVFSEKSMRCLLGNMGIGHGTIARSSPRC